MSEEEQHSENASSQEDKQVAQSSLSTTVDPEQIIKHPLQNR